MPLRFVLALWQVANVTAVGRQVTWSAPTQIPEVLTEMSPTTVVQAAAEIWMHLQASVEIMLQQHEPFGGLSTDLQKAFNCIGRTQVFMIAQHVGFPQKLLRPWKKFLSSFTRRFEIRNAVGEEFRSSSGFPEGCPLSILGMLCVNWTYHTYMQVFCPKVTAYSFVDNLTLAAREAVEVVKAFFALRCLCAFFGLTTDDSKTYVGGLVPQTRRSLSLLGFPCLQDSLELGGSMTLGRAVRNRTLKQRGQGLAARWQCLKRSMAPTTQKLTILLKFFWPAALDGAMNCLVADTYVHDLRKMAAKTLRLNGAGSNSLLRLSLSDDMCNDPGFYQLEGLDGYLTLLDATGMMPLQRSLLSALHSGAFISNAERAKYDPHKPALRTLCQCPDDRAHWLTCPRHAAIRDSIPDWSSDNVNLPDCLIHDLLAPRSQLGVAWRNALWHLEDRTFKFCSSPPDVVNATTAKDIALGPLPGITQSIDRAELTAVIAPLRWATFHQCDVCCWSDSKSTVQVANMLQRIGYVPMFLKPRDLWTVVLDLLQQCAENQVWFRWIPSHLPPHTATDAFEDWAILWNSHTDELAAMANHDRPAAFRQLFQEYKSELEHWSFRTRQLRQFYMKIAEAQQASPAASLDPVIAISDDEDDAVDGPQIPVM
eukprot:Skav234839  [mRNA]  locus=scaffold1428:194544:196872:- [translate_table: standard]